MEHLLSDGQRVPIVVPLLCAGDYDHGAFLGYPQRKDWDFSLWLQFNLFKTSLNLSEWLRENRKSEHELPKFLQSWLFFGLLESALQSPVKYRDFVRHDSSNHQLLTTVALETHLRAWNDRINRNRLSHAAREERLADLAKDMATASTIVDNLFRVIVYGNPPCRNQLEEVHFCASLLIRALAVASEHVLGRHPAIFHMGQGRMPLLERHMVETGWCPYMVSRITASFFNDTQAFAFALGTVRAKQDHRACSHGYCTANQVTESYTVQHIDPSCQCLLVGPPSERIVRSLRDGKVPMLRLEKATSKSSPTVLVEEEDLSGQYFAISRIWADGLGNPLANSVPECQLERIWHGVEEASVALALGGGSTPPFWLDTLCIPTDPKYQVYRDFSIAKMHEIYKNAKGVLVLDSDLALMSSNSTFAEVVTRTVISGWNTRLWTYQEATLTSNLFICAKDASLSLNHLMDGLVKMETWPDPLCHSLNISAAASFKSFIPKSRIKIDGSSDIEVQNMLMAIGKRITSRADDEAICIATTLGLDPSSLLATPPAERMVGLLRLLPAIPANVLFSTGKRLAQEGFRWAPESFLLPKGLA